MRRLIRAVLLAAAVAGTCPAIASDEGRGKPPTSPFRRPPPVAENFLAHCPLSFEANRGQAEPGTVFLVRGNGWRASMLSTGARIDLAAFPAASVTMRLRGARSSSLVEGMGPLPGRSNFFLGNDPREWVTDVPHFEELRVSEALPGVVLRWRGLSDGRLRYDFQVASRADPSSIVLDFEGADRMWLDGTGDLILATSAGTIRHSRPVAWQESGGRRKTVPCSFALEGKAARFLLGGHDPSLPVIIDPTITTSTVFGGGKNSLSASIVTGCALDSSGNIYMAGFTNVQGRATAGAYQGSLAGFDETFVVKFPSGSETFTYFTYLGGGLEDRCQSMALDASGAVSVTGFTWSSDFPTKNAIQTSLRGNIDGFVATIGPTGGTLCFSTYHGGTGDDYAMGVALDPRGNVWVAGWGTSTDLPLRNPLDSTGDYREAFLLCLPPGGRAATFSTYFGSSGNENFEDLAVADDGTIWATGLTDSTSFPTYSPAQPTYGGGYSDAVLVGFSSDGSTVVYSSYIGGSDIDEGYDVAVDSQGNPCVTGLTVSTDFPVKAALQPTQGVGFLYKLDAVAKDTRFCTRMGGQSDTRCLVLATDPEDSILVGGETSSIDLPLVSPTDSTLGGTYDMFLSKVTEDGSSLLFSTYHGGSPLDGNPAVDTAHALAVDGSVAVLAGRTNTRYYPWVNGWSTAYFGQWDAAFAAFEFLPSCFRNARASAVSWNKVTLSWTDSYSGVYGVEVQRRKGFGPGSYATIATPAAGATSYTDTTVEEGEFYYYRIRGNSSEWKHWLGGGEVPGPPSDAGRFRDRGQPERCRGTFMERRLCVGNRIRCLPEGGVELRRLRQGRESPGGSHDMEGHDCAAGDEV